MSMILAPAGSGEAISAHSVENSLIFDAGSTAYLYRAFAASDRKKWTYNGWHKRCLLTSRQIIFAAGNGIGLSQGIRFSADDKIEMYMYNGSWPYQKMTTGLYRDPSIWLNIHYEFDTANATAEDRVRLYVNGVRVTSFSTNNNPSLNYASGFVNDSVNNHRLGFLNSTTLYQDGYMAEPVFIDGANVDVNSFGEFHPDCPQIWRPIDLSGLDYSGTNSLHLDFQDAASATTLGYDVSGNANHFSPSGIATTDQSADTPTNNSCTMSSVHREAGGSADFTEGNLKVARGGNNNTATGTMAVSSGVYYAEIEMTLVGGTEQPGVLPTTALVNVEVGRNADGGVAYRSDGNKVIANAVTAYGAAYVTGDVIGIKLDLDAGTPTVTFYKNNVSQGAINLGDYDSWYIGSSSKNNGSFHTMVFNEADFNYTAPTGALPFMAKHLPAPVIKDPKQYFDPVIYTGNSTASRAIATQNKVDHLIIKNRDVADEWKVIDSVRGATNKLTWDGNWTDEVEANGVTALGASSGFTLGTGAGGYNDNTDPFVAYPFTKSATAGMDIVSYTGTGVAKTVAHSLGVKPELIMVKNRDGANGWMVQVEYLGATKYLVLDTNAIANTSSTRWNDTEPTSSVFSVGTTASVNGSGAGMIAYLFASVEGFSKVFEYTGNGNADGRFLYCGFKPAFLMIKRTDTTGNWTIVDLLSAPINPSDVYLQADLPNAEGNSNLIDRLANGFKLRSTAANLNAGNGKYVGVAFAEYPFALLNNGAL